MWWPFDGFSQFWIWLCVDNGMLQLLNMFENVWKRLKALMNVWWILKTLNMMMSGQWNVATLDNVWKLLRTVKSVDDILMDSQNFEYDYASTMECCKFRKRLKTFGNFWKLLKNFWKCWWTFDGFSKLWPWLCLHNRMLQR